MPIPPKRLHLGFPAINDRDSSPDNRFAEFDGRTYPSPPPAFTAILPTAVWLPSENGLFDCMDGLGSRPPGAQLGSRLSRPVLQESQKMSTGIDRDAIVRVRTGLAARAPYLPGFKPRASRSAW